MDVNDRKYLQDKRIKIFTRSFSLEMYRRASKLFDNQGVPVVRLTDQMADGYFFTILNDTHCDIAINIDEDAFVIDMDAIWDLVEEVVEKEYANAGCPDGGGGCPRSGNPIVTNPFFNVLNLELIRTLPIDKKSINHFNYRARKNEMEAAFPKEMLYSKYDFNRYDYEPYYPFFFWLAYNFKTLYLHSEKHPDGISTILYNSKKKPICYHSWFARFYLTDSQQRKRIDALSDEVYNMRGLEKDTFTFADKVCFSFDYFVRFCVRIPMRISKWPGKWTKWYRHYQERKL